MKIIIEVEMYFKSSLRITLFSNYSSLILLFLIIIVNALINFKINKTLLIKILSRILLKEILLVIKIIRMKKFQNLFLNLS